MTQSGDQQAETGNLFGVVTDNRGQSLPGVTVTLSGNGPPQAQVTDAEGMFRFLGLAPGDYQIEAELEGFSSIEYPNVGVEIGRNTTVELQMRPAVED